MSNFASSPSVILKNVRVQWGDIFVPRAGEANGQKTEPKYKVVVLFEPASEAASTARTAMMASAVALWGPNAKNVLSTISANSKALRLGNGKLKDDGAVRDEFKDMLYVSASNKEKPQVVGPKKHEGKFVSIQEDGRGYVDGVDVTSQLGYPLVKPYRGCYINCKVTFVAGKAFKSSTGELIPNQVYAKLEAVQFVRDGVPFGAGPTSAEGFEDEEIEMSPTGADTSDLL